MSDLRIVLLGRCSSGKSSAGNTILGGSVFKAGQRSAQCEVRHGDAAGRRVTVVDTPGWLDNSPLQDTTSEMDRLEIRNCMCLCPPGPHAVLLTVPVGQAFTKAQRVAVEEHMALLTRDVWSYAIVLFTHGDWLGETSIEQHIEAEGEDLRWLVARCGSRHHVFSNKERDEVTRVTELLEKMEEMVAGNRGGHYEVDGDVAEKISERKRNIAGDAQVFMAKTQRLGTALKALFEGEHQSLPDVNVMLVGGEKSARSTDANLNLPNKELLDTYVKEYKPQIKLTKCVRRPTSSVAGRHVSVVNCPDWSTAPPSQKIKGVLLHGVTLCSSGLHALLLIVSAMFSFSEADRRSVEEHMELLGDRVWRHTVVLFTEGWWLGERRVEDYIVAEGEPLRWLLEKCDYRYHVIQFPKWDISEETELMEKVEDMVTRNRGRLYVGSETRQKPLFETKERHRLRGTFTAEEWNRREARWKKREEEIKDTMLKFIATKPEAPALPAVRRRRDSMDLVPPSMSGGTPSETGSSYYRSPDKKVSDWLLKGGPVATSSDATSEANSSWTDADSRDGGSARGKENAHKGKKTFTAEEWNRQQKEWQKREEEMTQRMLKLVMGETQALPAVRRRRDSMDLVPPSMSGGTPSETGSSYCESPAKKVSDWLLKRHRGPATASSGYDTTSEAPTDADD